MAVEKNNIRDIKTDSRLVCVPRWKWALLSWYLSEHILGNYSEVVKRRSGVIHSEENPVIKVSDSSLECAEEDPKSFMNCINSSASNLFALDTDKECAFANFIIVTSSHR